MAEAGNVQVADEPEVLEIDQAQLEHLLNVGGGEAEFIDPQGRRIRFTAERLIDAGFPTTAIDSRAVVEMSEPSEFRAKSEAGKYFIINQPSEADSQSSLDMSTAVVCEDLSGVATETVIVTSEATDAETDRPPILSASVPLRNGIQAGNSDPAVFQDAKQLSDLLEEYRAELQEKDARLRQMLECQKDAEKKSIEIAQSLVKNVEWGEAEIYVGTLDAPENLNATVYVKRSRQHEAAPDDSISVQLDSGETCIVTMEDFTGQYLTNQAAQDIIAEARSGYHCCDRCPRRFTVESELKRHMEVGHPPRFPFHCTYCKKSLLFSGEDILQAHVRMFHGQKSFGKRRTRRMSMEREEREPQWELISTERMSEVGEGERVQGGEHQCTICLNIFPTAFSARKHLKDDHSIIDELLSMSLIKPSMNETISYQCSTCQKTFAKKEFLKKHKLAHTDRIPYACKFCPCRYKWKENLQTHLNAHGNQANYKCPDCRLIFFNQTRLDVHYKSRHPGRSRDQVCPLCEKSFHEKESLAKHMRGHSRDAVKCLECNKKFTDASFLTAHMICHTDVRRYVCQVCEKTFPTVELLSAHTKMHKQRTFGCSRCGRRFVDRETARAHMRCHSKLYPFECCTCSTRFMCTKELAEHERKHSLSKLYACSLCQKEFHSLDNLKLHVDSHNQVRPYPCAKCENAFYDQAALSRHMLLHSETMPYKCTACKKGFSRESSLSKHVDWHVRNKRAGYFTLTAKAGVPRKLQWALAGQQGRQRRNGVHGVVRCQRQTETGSAHRFAWSATREFAETRRRGTRRTRN